MKVFYMSPKSVPMNQVLFPNITPHLLANGHEITENICDSNIIFFDFHTRVAEYDEFEVDWVINSKIPLVSFEEFDKGGLSNLDWPEPLTVQQKRIFETFSNRKSVHFCRLLNKTKEYPSYLYPFEKPISFEEPICTPDDLFNREYDVVYIANGAPNRERIAEALRQDGRLKCLIKLGEPKLPFDEFLALHKRGKFFISSAAGGYTDERVQCLFSIAAIIRQRTDQWVANDFTHLENCLRIDSPPTEQDLNDLYEICNNKEKLYQIYLDGVTFVKQYWSAEAMGKRYLEILTKEGIL